MLHCDDDYFNQKLQKLKDEHQKKEDHRNAVYNFLFYCNQKWDHDGPTQFFDGFSIHYSDFMKAKRGEL